MKTKSIVLKISELSSTEKKSVIGGRITATGRDEKNRISATGRDEKSRLSTTGRDDSNKL